MSFAKAKIQRFNELENDVPPPGAYDPKFHSAIKSATLDKSDRFNANKNTTTAECNLSVCNRSTNQSSITFRTPQPAQKTNTTKKNTNGKSRSTLLSTDTKLKYSSENELADLQIECSNKTRTIQEHMKHIQDMQEERLKLQSQLKELQKNQAEAEERHQKEIESMIQLQQEVLNGHIEEHKSEIELLRKQLLETCEAKTHEIQTRKDLESDLRSRISGFMEKINTLESELTNQKHISEDKIKDLEKQIEELTRKLEKITQLHANCETKDAENSEMKNQLQKMAERLHETQNMLLKLEEKSSTQEIEISRLETMNRKLDLQLEESKVAMTEGNKFLEAETTKYKDTLSKANARIEELSDTIRTFAERDNNVEDKSELLEKERAQREAAEEQVKKLLEYNARLRKDHDEISEQYAGLIGHQNHKQRIKHVSQLKDKINQLEKDLRMKATKIEQQRKIIEKMKSEEKPSQSVPNKLNLQGIM
ncbi:uncharacterized protein LOC143357965 [Halictus rubicundus]|uniref:uncharacterized protein LOC143357965 n=1 Tax=Halictus rubicundus TaxID=77578 RepID=UPI0040355B33